MFGVKKLAGYFDARTYKNVQQRTLQAANAMPVGRRGSASARLANSKRMGTAAMEAGRAGSLSKSRKIIYGGGAALSASVATAARPNANQSRTSYRGPMQTGRGSGRFA